MRYRLQRVSRGEAGSQCLITVFHVCNQFIVRFGGESHEHSKYAVLTPRQEWMLLFHSLVNILSAGCQFIDLVLVSQFRQ